MPLTSPHDHRLSPRLQAVARLVPACRRVLDIGTDHAWLPIELVREGRCQEALAVDIGPGPLAIAERNIRAADLAGQVGLRLNDGLQGISVRSDDVVVVAGLGGYEIMRVLGEQPLHCQALILQPMKSLPELRIWLGRHGWAIDHESLVLEPRHAYVIIRAHYSGEPVSYDRLTAIVGPGLLQQRPAELPAYLRQLMQRLAKQKRGDPDLIPVIRQISQLAAELETNQADPPGGMNNDT